MPPPRAGHRYFGKQGGGLGFHGNLRIYSDLGLATVLPGGSSGSGGGGSSASDTNESCAERELFAPRAYGDNGSDLIRHIQVDPGGAIYFSTYQDIYVVQPGADAPELIAARPAASAPLYGEFWLDGDDLLFPSGDSTTIDSLSMDVLYALSVDGRDQRVLLSTSTPAPLDFSYRVTDAMALAGDELLWVEETIVRESGGGLGERTFRAKRQNFRSPGDVVMWHEGNGRIDDILISGELAFIGIDLDERVGSDEHRIVHFADGSAESMTAEARYGGEVLAADGASVIVSKLEGVFRYAPDGSGEQHLANFVTTAQNITRCWSRAIATAPLPWSFSTSEPARCGGPPALSARPPRNLARPETEKGRSVERMRARRERLLDHGRSHRQPHRDAANFRQFLG